MSKIGNTTIISGATAIAKAVTSIATRGKKLDRDIHSVGVSVLVHVRDHGDSTLVTRLIDAMPASSRRKALVAWINAHTVGAMVTTEKGEVTLEKGRTPDQFDVDNAEKVPFWEFTAEKSPVEVTLEGLLAMFEKRAKLVKGLDDVTRERMMKALHGALPSAKAPGAKKVRKAVAEAAKAEAKAA